MSLTWNWCKSLDNIIDSLFSLLILSSVEKLFATIRGFFYYSLLCKVHE